MPEPAPPAGESDRRSIEAGALFATHRASLLRMARRHSLCQADAEDALHSALLICLLKAPDCDRNGLTRWIHVVTRNEARALRRSRLRLLGSAAAGEDPDEALARLEAPSLDPHERFERAERVRRAGASIRLLRPDQRRALGLLAAGLSYNEIAERCGWTYTKVNRSIAEGRARLRQLTR